MKVDRQVDGKGNGFPLLPRVDVAHLCALTRPRPEDTRPTGEGLGRKTTKRFSPPSRSRVYTLARVRRVVRQGSLEVRLGLQSSCLPFKVKQTGRISHKNALPLEGLGKGKGRAWKGKGNGRAWLGLP